MSLVKDKGIYIQCVLYMILISKKTRKALQLGRLTLQVGRSEIIEMINFNYLKFLIKLNIHEYKVLQIGRSNELLKAVHEHLIRKRCVANRTVKCIPNVEKFNLILILFVN